MTYPITPGHKVPGTSAEAASAMRGKAPTLRDRIMEALDAMGSATADECAEWLGETVLAVRPRFTELHRQGRIADTGDRRENASGKLATVYRAKTIQRQAQILIESCDRDLRTVKARLAWIRQCEAESSERAESIRRTYGGTADEIEAACRDEWNRMRRERQ